MGFTVTSFASRGISIPVLMLALLALGFAKVCLRYAGVSTTAAHTAYKPALTTVLQVLWLSGPATMLSAHCTGFVHRVHASNYAY